MSFQRVKGELNMNLYKITIHGCEDSTTVLKVINSEEEINILKSTANSIAQTSTYGCMPVMEIQKITTQDELYYAANEIIRYETDVLSFYFKHHNEKELLIKSSRKGGSTLKKLKHNKEFLSVLQLELKPAENTFTDDYILVKTGDTKALIDEFTK